MTMPDRILRDELLTSERYWSVSIEAQRLFVHLVLCVDDTARFSGKNYTIRAACYPGQSVDPGKLEKLLLELVDTDLVRLYTVGMDRFIFLPRSKQRLRYVRSRYPAPPNEINDISLKKSVLSQSKDGLKSAEVKRREEKRSEEKELICTEPAKDRRSALVIGEGDVIQTLPSTKGEVEVRKSWVMEMIDAYPAVLVAQEVDRAKLWLEANPTKRKANVRRFLTNWMARTQERGGSK